MWNPIFEKDISELRLPICVLEGAKRQQIVKTGYLCMLRESEVLKWPGVGKKKLQKLKDILFDVGGVNLGMNIEDWSIVDRLKNGWDLRYRGTGWFICKYVPYKRCESEFVSENTVRELEKSGIIETEVLSTSIIGRLINTAGEG